MPVCYWLYFRVIHSDACLLLAVQDPKCWAAWLAGRGPQDSVRRATGQHMGGDSHGQDCPLLVVQHAGFTVCLSLKQGRSGASAITASQVSLGGTFFRFGVYKKKLWERIYHICINRHMCSSSVHAGFRFNDLNIFSVSQKSLER